MSRRAPSGTPAREPGTCYTLHFDPPYPADAKPGQQQAKHYTGWAKDLDARLAEHESGRGARLTQVQLAAGGSWRLASAEPGTRDREAQLKERGASRRCPVCQDERGEVAKHRPASARPAPEAAVLDPNMPWPWPGRPQEARAGNTPENRAGRARLPEYELETG